MKKTIIKIMITILAACAMVLILNTHTLGTDSDFIELQEHQQSVPAGYTGIYTASDLNNIRNNLSGKYILMNDIDLSSWGNWMPIGTSTSPFSGTLEGNSFEIKNMTINITQTGEVLAGLFVNGNNPMVNNLGIYNMNVSVTSNERTFEASQSSVGGIIGKTRTKYANDLQGRQISATLPNGSTETYVYDKFNNVLSKTIGDETTVYTYDNSSNLTSEKDSLGNITNYVYNKFNKLTQKTEASGTVITYTYDAFGNKLSEKDANSTTKKYYYDDYQNLTKDTITENGTDNPEVTLDFYTYDIAGDRLTKTDILGKVTLYYYDNFGNLVKNVDASTGYITTYLYDNANRLVEKLEGGQKETLYEYNILDKVTKKTEQNTDGTNAIVTSTAYDNVGNILSTTDGNGNVTVYTYDALNRKITEKNPLLQTTTIYTYDNMGNLLTKTTI
ncbi:MAG: hypothetical protein FWC53_00575 [Firmicutes bacterium]|nr:hypothetical protein [Bacillota bacterium]